ncbi:MAG: hypothetical protein II789_01515 [Clostridia bacterium]|nr:hypothetical protein [Clostridia bacterium]
MKKIFAMLIAVAVLLSLAVIGVSADEGRYVYNHTGDPNLADPFNSSMRIGHDSPTTVTVQFQTDVSFSKVFFPKIWCKAHSEVTIEILSGEEVVASKTFEAYNEANGSGDIDNVEVDFGKTVPAGPYTLRASIPDDFYAFFCYGADPLSEEYLVFERGDSYFGLWTTDAGEGFVAIGSEVPGGETPSFQLHGASFDTIYVNDVMNFGKDDGAASTKLDEVGRTIDGSDGSVQTIRIRGWIGFESEIDVLGYQINGENTFGEFKVAPEAAVTDPANGGQYATRFDMTIDVSNLKGTNKIVAVAKLADGTIVKIDENVSANGAGTTPNTSFTYVGPADDNVQTGDMTVAMFAVIAVLALSAAVVFAKKRSF